MQRGRLAGITLGLALLWAGQRGWGVEAAWEYTVQVSAAVQTSPPRITLNWPQDTIAVPTNYIIYRKAPNAITWGTGITLPGDGTRYDDTNVAVGSTYEYQIVKTASTYVGYGYIYAGIEAPLVEERGKVLLIVDNTYAADLVFELNRLQQDLVGDGWTVLRHDVARTENVRNVKALIQADYFADPTNVKAAFFFGHVPVPYSGLLNPDGHADHYGAWPADVFYGDIDGSWTDESVNYTQTLNTNPADAARLSNVPGDGKFDQISPPSAVELQVGRVDLSKMTGLNKAEKELLKQYLDKDHNFRHKLITAQRRGLIHDSLGVRNGRAFAASGWRNFAPFFGASNVLSVDVGQWVSTLATNDFLWAYGCGAGSYDSISGLGTTGIYLESHGTEMVAADVKVVFAMLCGSWFGDWDSENNVMRAILATPTYGLACTWAGRPHWFCHHMALGETIGFSTRLSQNNSASGLYQNQTNVSAGRIHVALMGDPTLRMHPVAPPSAFTSTSGPDGVHLGWIRSTDAVLGYHVYRAANPAGPFTRLTGSLVNGTSFLDTNVFSGSRTYMVRAVNLEVSASGTYFNPSQGIILTTGGASLDLTITGITRSPEGGVTITWISTPDKTYRVAYKNNFADSNWMNLSSNVIAAGTSTSFTDTTANASKQRYYTVYVIN